MSQTMTLDEKLTISNRALDLLDAGDQNGYMRLMKTAPMPPYLAKIYKETIGDNRIRTAKKKWLEFVRSRGRIWIRLA